MKNKPLIIAIIVALAALGAGYYFGYDRGFEKKGAWEITSFQECADAGYPVGESYPRQCWTPDGKHFVEEIGDDEDDSIGDGGGVACTMDAKQCPDGSYVGRTGPKCEFAQCPSEENPTSEQVTLREGERDGPLLVQKIYADYITGIQYREYPVATDQGSAITLRVGESASNGCTITLTLIRIEGGSAVFTKKTDYNRPCPICLAEGTLIDTPNGAIAVQNLREGMDVWTVDANGARVVGKIMATGRTETPLGHLVAHIILTDGRELFVSPGHPTADGRIVGELLVGDILDGARIKSAELIPYLGKFTYDILPSGNTGAYFANGILVGSTIK